MKCSPMSPAIMRSEYIDRLRLPQTQRTHVVGAGASDWHVIRNRADVHVVEVNAALLGSAIPYDMPITGYGTDNVGTLRLWKSEPIDDGQASR